MSNIAFLSLGKMIMIVVLIYARQIKMLHKSNLVVSVASVCCVSCLNVNKYTLDGKGFKRFVNKERKKSSLLRNSELMLMCNYRKHLGTLYFIQKMN